MNVLHLVSTFYPDSAGGTEVYVAALAHEQINRGHDPIIAAPSAQDYEDRWDGLRVVRYPVPKPERMVHDDLARRDAGSALGEVLDREHPDVLHLHDFTPALSGHVVRAAHERAIPAVFTYHMPTASCPRGSLMRWGHVPCDGYLSVRRCTACRLQGRGAMLPLALAASVLPPRLGASLPPNRPGSQLRAFVAASERTRAQQEATRSFWSDVDHIVAMSQWSADVLRFNGVPAEKITLSPHGLHAVETVPTEAIAPVEQAPILRLISIGRVHRDKGWDVVIRAIQRLPYLPIQFDLYGIVQGADSEAYLADIKRLVGDDRRISLHDPVPNQEIRALLRLHDYLVVPSQVLETGPLVVLEAQGADVPVIGSGLGGVAELVSDGVDGVLVRPPDSPEVWARVLERACADRALAARLRSRIRCPRTIADVAEDMDGAYRSVVSGWKEPVGAVRPS